MDKLIYATILVAVILYCHLAMACNGMDPLFTIERSNNRNVVHYDACLVSNGELSPSDPVKVYWMMETGQKEDLTWLEEHYAYGIGSEEKLKGGGVEISLAAFGRKMSVTKIDGRYRVIVFINGQRSILEKVYLNCRPGLLGIPKVLYADLFGEILATGASAVERVEGKGSPSG